MKTSTASGTPAERAIVQALEEGAIYRVSSRGAVLCGQECHLLPRDEVYGAHQGRILVDPVEVYESAAAAAAESRRGGKGA